MKSLNAALPSWAQGWMFHDTSGYMARHFVYLGDAQQEVLNGLRLKSISAKCQ